MSARFFKTLAGLACMLVLAAPAAHAALPQQGGSVDLASPAPNSVFDGVAAGDRAGTVVVGAGDVNGDGLGDALVTAPFADPAGRRDAGSAYVVFGSAATSGALDLRGL